MKTGTKVILTITGIGFFVTALVLAKRYNDNKKTMTAGSGTGDGSVQPPPAQTIDASVLNQGGQFYTDPRLASFNQANVHLGSH